jgi:hypothetical protein
MNRRSFVGVTAAALILPRLRISRPTIGLEINTYDDATLAAVAAIGYRDVVINDLYAPINLSKAGLTASTVHVTTPLLYRGIDRHLAKAKALGCRYFVLGRVDPEERRTAQDWHELAALCNRAGEAARKAGLRFGYRLQIDDSQFMVRETDPALVWFESMLPMSRCFALDIDQASAILPGDMSAEYLYVRAASVDAAKQTYERIKRLGDS